MMFYLGAFALGLISCLFVIIPLAYGRKAHNESERTDLNVALYKEHVSELVEQEDAEQLTLEAQKVLLSETSDDAATAPQASTNRHILIIVAVLLPIFGGLIYLDFGFGQGAMPDVRLTEQMVNTNPADRTDYRRFVSAVEARAERKPDDEDIQFLLARAYLNLDEYDAAADVMSTLVNRFPEDPNLLSQYAEVLYLQAGRKITKAVGDAIDEALRINPSDITMMEIQAIAAIEAGNPEVALSWFERALGTGVTGRRAEIIRIAMSRLTAAETAAPVVEGRSLQVQVSKAEDLELAEAAVVFVYARAAVGPPAPLAVQRFPVSALPLQLTLDESMAMVPGMSLGTFDEVVVVARISQTGQVVPTPGDFEATSEVLDLTGSIAPIRLNIVDPL